MGMSPLFQFGHLWLDRKWVGADIVDAFGFGFLKVMIGNKLDLRKQTDIIADSINMKNKIRIFCINKKKIVL